MTPPSASAHGAAEAAPGSALTVRRLLVDLRAPLSKRWHRNDFLTQFFNALSMSFPVGEQFFIDSVRAALPMLAQQPEHQQLRHDIAQFIGQEAAHRQIHAHYNAHLEFQGLVNKWQHWALRRQARAARLGMHPKSLLAVTCAYEHLTSTLAHQTLQHADALDGAEERMQTLWRWHASEEIEHRSVAFDLYQAVGGNHRKRVQWYLFVLLTMALEATAQTVLNLKRSGTLWRVGTWRDGLAFFLGRQGLVWRSTPALLRYVRRDFHPQQQEPGSDSAQLAQQWLAKHASQWRGVR
jgi:predicted metal-dependent hydrolase